MKAFLCRLLDRAARWLGRLIGHDDPVPAALPPGCGRAARTAGAAVTDVVSRARDRHTDRYRNDEHYRAALLAAVGALLGTLFPPRWPP